MGSDGRLLCAYMTTPRERKPIMLPWLARLLVVPAAAGLRWASR